MNRKSIVALVAACLLALAAALYFSPHWTLYRMRSALEARDAAALSSHVDFPALRESAKAQMLTYMNQQLGGAGNPLAAGLGQMLATGVINQLVETVISPAGVMVMMQEGQPLLPAQLQSRAPPQVPPVPPTAPTPQAPQMPPTADATPAPQAPQPKASAPRYDLRYVNWSTVEVHGKALSTPGKFIFTRHAFFNWKLSGIEMSQPGG